MCTEAQHKSRSDTLTIMDTQRTDVTVLFEHKLYVHLSAASISATHSIFNSQNTSSSTHWERKQTTSAFPRKIDDDYLPFQRKCSDSFFVFVFCAIKIGSNP